MTRRHYITAAAWTAPPLTWLILWLIWPTAALLVLVATAIAAAGFYFLLLSKWAAARDRPRTMFWRIKLHLKPGPGFTGTADMMIRWSRLRAVIGHGGKSRPFTTVRERLFSSAHNYAVCLGRSTFLKRIWVSREDQGIIISLPRTGKTGALGNLIVKHPGPVVVTTTRADLFNLTAGRRANQGPIWVFNPQNVGGIPSTFAFDVLRGCEDPETAFRRAGALIGKRVDGGGDMAFWQEAAVSALAGLVHAAALGGLTVGEVFRWACGEGSKRAEDIIRETNPGPLLAAVMGLRDGSKMAASIRGTMRPSLQWVCIPGLVEAGSDDAGQPFNVEEFIRSNGTIYMIGDAEKGPVANLFTALLDFIHYEARMVGSRNIPRGKLDPPLGMFLDEVTQICPVPLDKWMPHSGGFGITITAVVHGRAQLVKQWGQAAAQTIMDCCGYILMFGGIHDAKLLDDASQLFGLIPYKDAEGNRRERPVVTREVIHQCADQRAFVIYRNRRAVAVTPAMVWWQKILPVPALTPVLQLDDQYMPETVELPVADPALIPAAGNGHHPAAEPS